MNTIFYNCKCCEYKSNNKYNVYRHMVAKHIDFDNQNVSQNNQNVSINKQNVNTNEQNVSIDNICNKCNKKLASNQSLNRHILICKGISNPLECHKCHKIFSHRSSKSKHLKTCNNNELIEISDKNNEISNINNNIPNNIITLNSITNNNNTINNTNTYNINLIIYDKETEKIDFDTSHLKYDFMYKLLTRSNCEAFKYYCEKLFENNNNQMIIKRNLKNKFTEVHIGLNVWEKFIDDNIYPKIMNLISELILSYIYDNKKTNSNKIKEFINYLDIMADDGFSSENTKEFNQYYKNNIKMLKNIFHKFI